MILLYTSGLAHRISDFIDYAVRIALKSYLPGVKPLHLEYSIFAHVHHNLKIKHGFNRNLGLFHKIETHRILFACVPMCNGDALYM